MMFGGGNFEAPMLVHDSANVPGTKAMAERDALAAIHAVLRFQIAEHETGDPITVRVR